MSETLKKYMADESYSKVKALNNEHVEEQLIRFIKLCKPSKVTVLDGFNKDLEYIRNLALSSNEESRLKIKGHTIHFDGLNDLARDKGSTKVLTPQEMILSDNINTTDREGGLKEVLGIMNGVMRGKEMLVKFYSLGPTDSRFSLCAMQITDSSYVAHSEDLLYRQGYEQFKKLKGSNNFFLFIHSAGELTESNVTKNVHLRRIYIDVIDGKVYSVNNQYAGNSVGLKKLALRLAIYKANHEDWLCEHMLIMGIHPPDKDRVTYFTGAYPSACGKTSTAMIPGQSIVGDDIAYLKEDLEGYCRAVNIEQGIFGIIQDVNPEDDPVIYNALTTPRELIFSNILISDGGAYWLGMGEEPPESGVNYQGEWYRGMKDAEGKEIPFAHPNARYTMRLSELENVNTRYNDPEGVRIMGIFYGGRDSDTNVPISEALSWEHGVYLGATLESETTTATIGKTGVRKQDPMANIDFVVVPLGLYISNHIKFGRKLMHKPRVYSTNYFLKHEGRYTNTKLDKKIWVLWAEGRVNGEYKAIKTPVGYIPYYEDLNKLFKQVFDRDYSKEEYDLEFSIRLDKYFEKHARMDELYKNETGMPREFWDEHNRIKKELESVKTKSNKSVLPPSYFI